MTRRMKIMAGAVGGVALVTMASTAIADAGGDPEHLGTAVARPAPERVVEVVPAASPKADMRAWHDKTEAEWQAYHREQDRIRASNFGR